MPVYMLSFLIFGEHILRNASNGMCLIEALFVHITTVIFLYVTYTSAAYMFTFNCSLLLKGYS